MLCSVSPPAVLWAQRNSTIFLTICLEDCREPVLQINPSNIYFRGVGGTERKEHEVNIELYKEIVPDVRAYFFFYQFRNYIRNPLILFHYTAVKTIPNR